MFYAVDARSPSTGEPLSLEFGGRRWLLERSRHGVTVYVLRGEETVHESLLGLPERGCDLRFEGMAPRHPIELGIGTELTLAPGGQVRGWLALPLDLRLVHVPEGDAPQPAEGQELLRVRDPELRLGWREGQGYHHPWDSRLLRAPGDADEDRHRRERLWLRARIRNDSEHVVHTRRCRIALAGFPARVLRGMAMGPSMDWNIGPLGGIRFRHLPVLTTSDGEPAPGPRIVGGGEVGGPRLGGGARHGFGEVAL